MTLTESEYLRNKGFRIYKVVHRKIHIKTNRGWSVFCDYSEARWSEIQANPKNLVDNDECVFD